MTGLALGFWEVASSCFTGATFSITVSTGSMMDSTGASVLVFTVASMAEAGSTVNVDGRG
jgi:hypothetical protein